MNIDLPSFDFYHPQPLVVVISGPSGVGKDSVINTLKNRQVPFHFVVTAASRPPRPGEVHGVDYFFVSRQEFEHMLAQDELIEHAIVYNEYKGIPKAQVRQALQSGKDVIIRVDVQGAERVRFLFPEAVLIFILPENAEAWQKRFTQRNTETEETLRTRLTTAQKEMEYLSLFDYIVVNQQGKLEEAADTIESIIRAEHHRYPHRKATL